MITPFYEDSHVTIYHGDSRVILPQLPAASVHCCVTSPPYFNLRDYGGGEWRGGDEGCDHAMQRSTSSSTLGLAKGQASHEAAMRREAAVPVPYRDTCGKCGATRHDQQIGLEATPAAYVAELTGVFEQVRRCLRNDGTLWCNLGDSYNSAASNQNGNGLDGKTRGGNAQAGRRTQIYDGIKVKDLIGIPWRVAFALQEAGWWLRSDIIWSKPNCMPESVTDRPTRSHEYVFLLSQSERYYYDAEAIREPFTYAAEVRVATPKNLDGLGLKPTRAYGDKLDQSGRNRRSVWTISTQSYSGAHFAVFPEKLIEPCILAGSRAGDIVIDPFAGSGTTGVVAKKFGRRAILIEQSLEYCRMAADRIEAVTMPLALEAL